MKKIYFSQKGRESNQKEVIANAIDHCYKGKQKFVSEKIHKLLTSYCERIQTTPGLEMETNYLDARGKEEKDENMLEYLLIDLSSITGIENLIDKRKLHYMIIFVIDILSLKEFLPKLLLIDSEFSVEEIGENQANVHQTNVQRTLALEMETNEI